MRWAVLVTMCACGRVGFDPSSASDGASGDGGVIPDADRRLYGGFANPERTPIGFFSDPQLSSDGNEIWSTIETTDFADPDGDGTGEYNLFVSRRVNGAFTPMELQTLALNSIAPDTEPALSADGRVMVFISERGGAREVYEVTRASSSQTWSTPPRMVFTLEPSSSIGSIDLHPSGTTLFYENGYETGDIWKATRATIGDSFVTADHVGVVDMNFISVSSDERLMFGNRIPLPARGMRWAWRASTSDPWTVEPDNVTLEGCDPVEMGDPDISPDGTHLVVNCLGLVVYTR